MPLVALSSGASHVCGISKDAEVLCWGDNEFGKALPPQDERLMAIAGGINHMCGVRLDTSIVCWGNDATGQASPPAGNGFVAVSSGWDHSCAPREDRTAVCWGASVDYESVRLLDGQRFTAISSGESGFYALRTDGGLVCSVARQAESGGPPRRESFTAVSLGRTHGCALRADGAPLCWWKGNAKSDLVSLLHERHMPLGKASLPTQERFVSISSGRFHTCALRDDQTVRCWGASPGDMANRYQQAGYGQTESPAGDRFTTVSSGDRHTCALRTDGMPVC